MIELELPDPLERDLTLDSADSNRGSFGPGDEVLKLAGRVKIGGPESVGLPIASVKANQDLSLIVDEHSPRYAFHLVYLSISFPAPLEMPRLRSATVTLQVTAVPPDPKPKIMDMQPQRVTTEVSVGKKVRIDPELKFLDAELHVGEYAREASSVRHDDFLVASGLDSGDGRWDFRRTDGARLAGSYRLRMTVRVGAGSLTSVSGLVTARTGGDITRLFRRELPDPLQIAAVL